MRCIFAEKFRFKLKNKRCSPGISLVIQPTEMQRCNKSVSLIRNWKYELWCSVSFLMFLALRSFRTLAFSLVLFSEVGVAGGMLARCLPHSSLIVTHRGPVIISWSTDWLTDWLIDWLTAGCRSLTESDWMKVLDLNLNSLFSQPCFSLHVFTGSDRVLISTELSLLILKCWNVPTCLKSVLKLQSVISVSVLWRSKSIDL